MRARHLLYFCAFLLFAAFYGCSGTPLPHIRSIGDLSSHETIVVGKIEIVPPLKSDEQDLSFTMRQYKGKVVLITDDQYRKLHDLSPSDYDGRIEAPLGKTFYVKAPNKPLYVLVATIFMTVKQGGVQQAYLPAGFKIDIRPGDKAVYIGTLRYHRDEFFGITKVELVDNHDRELAEFNRKFGGKFKLRKALVSMK